MWISSLFENKKATRLPIFLVWPANSFSNGTLCGQQCAFRVSFVFQAFKLFKVDF
jgi:hypothetical protein